MINICLNTGPLLLDLNHRALFITTLWKVHIWHPCVHAFYFSRGATSTNSRDKSVDTQEQVVCLIPMIVPMAGAKRRVGLEI